ncbi:nitrogenase component 1 [Fusobacterium varium]|uniref:nitrogenase component 1 n=1 Tax=Fusobacterium TaxID=848 RepID=UPI0015A3BFF3
MNKFNRLPIPNSRMGTLLTITGIDKTAIIEYGPSGTTHFAMDFLMGTSFERSNLFSAHIKENDLLFGETERLEKAIIELDKKNLYEYIFVATTSLTTLVGIDITACCNMLQEKVKARLIPLEDSGSYGDISVGIENGFFILVSNFCEKKMKNGNEKFNIIGLSKNDCFYKSDKKTIESIIKNYFSLTLNSCLNISEKIDKLKDISEAEINIVVRPEGIKAAKYLEKYCGIPYIIANFYGLDNIKNTLEKIGNILKKSKASYLILEEIKRITEAEIVLKRKLRNRKLNVCISGNYFEACGLCSLLENDLNILVKKIIINHKITTLHTEHYKEYLNKIIDREKWDETEKYDLILGDEELLNYLDGEIKIRVSNPNIQAKFLSSENSFMGVEGILKMGEMILNQIK